jgi:hypothetical protein
VKRRRRQKNALTHGLYATDIILPGEDEEEFRRFYQDILSELNPVGASEVDEVVDVTKWRWIKRRVQRWAQRAMRGEAESSFSAQSTESLSDDQQKLRSAFQPIEVGVSSIPSILEMIAESVHELPDADRYDHKKILQLIGYVGDIVTSRMAPALQSLQALTEQSVDRVDPMKALEDLLRLQAEIDKRIEKTMSRFYSLKIHKGIHTTKPPQQLREIEVSPPIANDVEG